MRHRESWFAEWHSFANAALVLIVVLAYIAHFFEGALGDRARAILEGPSLLMLILLYVVLIASRLESTRIQVDDRLDGLERNRLLEFVQHLDPVLKRTLGSYINDAIANVASAVLKAEIEFKEPSVFPFLYQQVLDAYPQRTFFAVTKPHKPQWLGDDVYSHMRKFLTSEGQIRRIFIVDVQISDVEKAVINRHLSTGVKVATVCRSRLEKRDFENFLVESTGEFGWRAVPGMLDGCEKLVATSSRSSTAEMIERFHRLWRLSVEIDEPLR